MPFQPGQSGNPGGSTKLNRDIKELAREHAPAAIRALVEALADPKQRVAAAVALLDRGFGKPKQEIETSGGMNLNVVTGIERAPDEIADQSR
jgi:hypothetical protein